MARTIGDIITEARALINDSVAPLRYSDHDLYDILDNALGVARRIRPDLFLALGLRSEPAPIDPTMANQPWVLDWMYTSSFVWYVAGRAELREDEFTQDERAVILLQKFTGELMTPT